MQPEKAEDAEERFPYRMKDLCELTGLPRQVIHFYIHEGLLPEGKKTGRNMAYYGERHLARLRLIRKLQHERFLPLKAIKAILDEQEETFSPTQRRLLAEVKERLDGSVRPRAVPAQTTDATQLLDAAGLERRDLDEMVELGLLAAKEDDEGHLHVSSDDAWMISTWAELRAIGFTRDLGFSPADLAILEEAVSALFKREVELVRDRLSSLPPDRLAAMVQRSLPILGAFLARYHETKVKNFFSAMVSPQAADEP